MLRIMNLAEHDFHQTFPLKKTDVTFGDVCDRIHGKVLNPETIRLMGTDIIHEQKMNICQAMKRLRKDDILVRNEEGNVDLISFVKDIFHFTIKPGNKRDIPNFVTNIHSGVDA